jgi:hypothetical protein
LLTPLRISGNVVGSTIAAAIATLLMTQNSEATTTAPMRPVTRL